MVGSFDESGPADTLSSALEAMPIFPLPGMVLFPGALLPLHIFEPRYRVMLSECLATHRWMALAFALSGGDAEGSTAHSPKIARIAGAGVVVRHEALADGRSNIVVRGIVRVSLDELAFVAPYRRAKARVLNDVDSPVSATDRTGLRAAASAFAAAAKEKDFAIPAGLEPGAIADVCAHQLVVDPWSRQRALEELDIRARVRLVTTTLAEQLGRKSERRAGAPD